MPRPYPPEFRQRDLELARPREKPIADIARGLGISESCLNAARSPMSLYEYLAAGLRVVATEVPELCRRNLPDVCLVNSPEHFAAAISSAVALRGCQSLSSSGLSKASRGEPRQENL